MEQLLPLASSTLKNIERLDKGRLLDPLSSTLFYYIIIRFSSNDASFLKIQGGWKMFLQIMDLTTPILQVTGTTLAPQDLVVNYKVLKGISGSEKQIDILDTLITRCVKTKLPSEAARLKRELKKLSMSPFVVNSLLGRYSTRPKIKSVREARAIKRRMMQETLQESSKKEMEENWLKIGLVVEFVGVMEDLKDPWLLLKPLSLPLKHSLEIDSYEVDIFQQQILSVLHHLITKSISQTNRKDFLTYLDESIVSCCVQCIRQSVNPDTHRRALLILALLSDFFPEKVLHNIMAIFTFMGNSLLRRDDAYSFQVIHETISSIVPTLIKTESSDPTCLLKKLAQVTQVFVDALPDLADHRKLPLFSQLAETLGVSQYLWLVMVLIADSCVLKVGEPKGVPVNIQFALLLYCQFSVIDQLKASFEILNFACNLPIDEDRLRKKKTDSYITNVINLTIHSLKQLYQLKYSCIGLLGHLISSERFVGQVYELEKEDNADLITFQSLLQQILEKALHYVQFVSTHEELHRGTSMGKFWLDIQRKLMDLVHSVNSLLPPASFLEIIRKLLRSDIPIIRTRAIEFLASKLQPDSKFFSVDDADELSGFLSILLCVVEKSKETVDNKQLAMYTLQLLIRFLGRNVDSSLILPALQSSIQFISCNSGK